MIDRSFQLTEQLNGVTIRRDNLGKEGHCVANQMQGMIRWMDCVANQLRGPTPMKAAAVLHQKGHRV